MNSILTVVTAADSYDLTTLATVKAEMKIASGETKFDALISNDWIPQASAAVATYCNRVFALESVTETFRHVRCLSELLLSRFPVSSITTVEVDGVTLDADEYEIASDSGILYRLSSDCRIEWNASKIVVTYDGGYALLGELPREIERAVVLLIKFYRYTLARDPLVKRENIPGVIETEYWVTTDGTAAMPKEVTDLLDPHRSLTI